MSCTVPSCHICTDKCGLTSSHPSLPQNPMEKKKINHALLHLCQAQNIEAHRKESGTRGVLDLPEDPFPLLLLVIISGERQTDSCSEESVSPPSLQLLSIVVGALVRGAMSHRHHLATRYLWELHGHFQPWCAVVCSTRLWSMDISVWSGRGRSIFPPGSGLMPPRLNLCGEGQQVPAEGALEPQT